MKIIECHIENFGRLSDVCYSFNEGLNIINEPNGAGKSTLAAFIKVMFFGFSGEGKRSELENERKRFKPWQGGVYGGQLTFCYNNKTYELVRCFGAKDKDDEFTLYDKKTNIVSSDFSSNIGEELFGIDHDSFCRTVYIAASDCSTGATDSINAKLGNLADNTDDINNYETVKKRLADMLNQMSPTRKTGSIYKKKQELAVVRDNIRTGEAINDSIAMLTEKLKEERQRSKEYKEEQAKISEQINEQLKNSELIAEKKSYEQIAKDCEEKKKECDEARNYFNELPDENDIGAMLSCLGTLSGVNSAKNALGLSEDILSRLADDKVSLPDDSELEEMSDMYRRMNDKKNMLTTKKTSLVACESFHTDKKNSNVFNIMGIILVILGICIAFVKFFAGLLFVVAGVFVITVSGLIKSNNSADDSMDKLAKEINDDEIYIEEAHCKLTDFIKKHGYNDEDDMEAALKNMKEFRHNSELFSRYKEYEKQEEELSGKVTDYICNLGFSAEDDMYGQLLSIKDRLSCYYEAKKWYNRACEEKKKFEAEHDMAKLDISVQELKENQVQLYEQLKSVNAGLELTAKNISDYSSRIESANNQRDALSEEEARAACLESELENDLQKLDIIAKTQKYLDIAKESFTARYMEPVMEGFRIYYGLIDKDASNLYQLDANMDMSKKELGNNRDIRMLSSGYRNLVGLSMRMALVNAMYQHEKPFVVFDDPFIYMDNDMSKKAKDFITEVSKNYQVIYFTCNDSRALS